MYQIILNGKSIGFVKNPIYTKYNEDVFVPTTETDATFIYYNDTTYNILGKSEDENFDTVMLVPVDEGVISSYQNNLIDGLIINAIS